MAGPSKSPNRFPSVSVVVPKMEMPLKQPPTPSQPKGTVPKAAAPPQTQAIPPHNHPSAVATAPPNGMATPISAPQVAPQPGNMSAPADTPISETALRDSEMQLVSSLAKLQKLETSIHQLRDLLPDRLLDPLLPILNPRVLKERALPKSPQALLQQLSQTARAGVAEVNDLGATWRGDEMKPVWDRVQGNIRENGGQLLQPTGMWERDYNVLLEELEAEEKERREQQAREEEEAERSRIQTMEGGWKAVVDAFVQRRTPGVKALVSQERTAVEVVLVKAGMAFSVRPADGSDGSGVPDWEVESKSKSQPAVTKLESAVADCLNACPRRWDLAYLLDLISSYSDIKQRPCVKCGQVMDQSARLPTIRQPQQTQSDGQTNTAWEAYHPNCI
ncbi:RNA polymerase II mediator complex subunit MED27 domain-containing protein [Aspergillus candidus]|uniref:Mediator complex subunit 27-domain-containing protein n=1 Tax=Aspergillus candidus TaxID=41067 RepID=A0A2I2FIP0_ASPCN|nr:hypothetical protein BDW47DRAFT_88418 [Aspergillus candidus]PLB40495.1 hypothetical protein BDW47DRAFT_88418 [Aspergillus candidus]